MLDKLIDEALEDVTALITSGIPPAMDQMSYVELLVFNEVVTCYKEGGDEAALDKAITSKIKPFLSALQNLGVDVSAKGEVLRLESLAEEIMTLLQLTQELKQKIKAIKS